MEKLVHKIPFLRLTLSLSAGIVLAEWTAVPANLLLAALIAGFALLLVFQLFYRYSFERLFGLVVGSLFVLFGMLLGESYNNKPDFPEKGNFLAMVLERPEDKPASYKSLLRIRAVSENGSFKESNEKLLIYFAKTRAAALLAPGDLIIFDAVPQEVNNNGNPCEFDYKNYLARKKIYRRVYIDSTQWQSTSVTENTLATKAEKTREKLLAIYRSQHLGNTETEILSALTLGYKRGLDPETKRVFSAAGAMHVLAVSGLHVGIIFAVFSLFFGFLKRLKNGKYFFVLLSLLLLWTYALLTGMSPSVMRAATMFSLVSIGMNLNRRANIYNTLAISAFILLLINPNNLFEVGFQLSYAAVFGIVFLQPKMERLWPVRNKIMKFFWSLLTVSVAAQIATFPITSFYFNQFPTYFWLTNLVVIPAAFVLIVLGLSLLAFSAVPLVAGILAETTKFIILLVYATLAGIENLPRSVVEIALQPGELIALLAAIFFLFVFIEFLRMKHLKLTLVSVLVLMGTVFVFNFRQATQKQMIVYNSHNLLLLELIDGKSSYLIANRHIEQGSFEFEMTETVRKKWRLNTPLVLHTDTLFEDKNLLVTDGIIHFSGKTIFLQKSPESVPANLSPDYLIAGRYHKKLHSSVHNRDCRVIVASDRDAEMDEGPIYLLAANGSYYERW